MRRYASASHRLDENSVLTWPLDMEELDLDQLIILSRKECTHRPRRKGKLGVRTKDVHRTVPRTVAKQQQHNKHSSAEEILNDTIRMLNQSEDDDDAAMSMNDFVESPHEDDDMLV
jgi:hypothetical protein